MGRIKVRALSLGYAGDRRRRPAYNDDKDPRKNRPADEFYVSDEKIQAKNMNGEFIFNDDGTPKMVWKEFSPNWMEPLEQLPDEEINTSKKRVIKNDNINA